MQRTMLAGGRVDADGFLADNPSEPAWNLLRVTGPLDASRLAAAVHEVTSATEILHLRVRATADGPRLAPRPVPVELAVVETLAPQIESLVPVLGPLLFGKVALPDAPSGRICLVHGPADEHLLALSFDHTVLDGWSAGLLVKAIAQCYKSGTYVPRGPSFRDHVSSLPPRAVQDENLAEWRRLLADHPVPGPALRFPGSVPAAEYRIDGYYDATFPPSLAEDLTTAVARTGLSRAEVLTSACALAVSTWSDGPQPLLSLRHGHTRPEDILVIGPLVEPYVLLPPTPSPPTVAGWLTAHAEANRHTPPLHGRSIREVTPLAPRNAALNVVPPARPVSFGPRTRAVTVPRAQLAPLWADGRPTVPSTAAFWLNLFLDQPGRVEISITHDTRVLPDPALLAGTIASVVASAANTPGAEAA
jgi:hypothetical protein